MTDPTNYAAQQALLLQQQQAAAAAQYAANPALYQQQLVLYQQQYQAQLAAQHAAAPRAKPANRKQTSQPLQSRQSSRRRDYESDDDDDDEFEDYSHLLTPAERERRKKRLVGTGDRESDDDFHTPGDSSSSSEEEESSTDEEEEDESDGSVTTSEEEDFGYGPPKKDRDAQSRKRSSRASDEDSAGSDDERRGKKNKKAATAEANAKALVDFVRTVEVPLRRQLLRFFTAVAASYAHKQEVAKANAAGSAVPTTTWPALPSISLSLAEWERPEQQRMAFCELLNLCPVEGKPSEPYHYQRKVCETGVNFYCTFQPDRPQPAKAPAAPHSDWVKRFEDRVKQWFALDPISQYMATLPAVSNDEKNSDAIYQSTILTVGQQVTAVGNVDINAILAQAVATAASAAAPPSAAAEAPAADEKKSEKKEKKTKKGKGKKAAVAHDDDEEAHAEEETATAGKKRGRKGAAADAEGGSRKKQKKAAAAAAEDSDDDAKDEKKGVKPQPSDAATARTLFLQQIDVSVRRNVLQLIASSIPSRLVDGHRENFAKKFGADLIALTFARICELAGITPKPFDAKTTETQVTSYFTFKIGGNSRAPSPTFVYAFQHAVREWLRTAPVVALMASEYWIPSADAQVAEDAEFNKAQGEARATAPIEYLYSPPGSAGVTKAGGNA